MTDHVQASLVELGHHHGHAGQGVGTGGFELGAGAVEGDVVRHVEDQLIAVASHADAGALQLLAQLGFLHIHVVTDTATQGGASGHAGQYALLAITLAGGERAHGSAGGGTGQCAPGALGGLGFTGIGIGGTACHGDGQGKCRNQFLEMHEKTSEKERL
ncbi:hypothetical protein D3C84_421830 [compost metagenome]